MPSEPALEDVFAALADPTRRGLLERLRGGPATVSALVPAGMALTSCSKHLRVLEAAGLVTRTTTGRHTRVALAPGGLAAAAAWLAAAGGQVAPAAPTVVA